MPVLADRPPGRLGLGGSATTLGEQNVSVEQEIEQVVQRMLGHIQERIDQHRKSYEKEPRGENLYRFLEAARIREILVNDEIRRSQDSRRS